MYARGSINVSMFLHCLIPYANVHPHGTFATVDAVGVGPRAGVVLTQPNPAEESRSLVLSRRRHLVVGVHSVETNDLEAVAAEQILVIDRALFDAVASDAACLLGKST